MARRSIVSIVAGVLIGAVAGTLLPGDMMTRFLVAICVLLLTMVLGVYFLDRNPRTDDSSRHR